MKCSVDSCSLNIFESEDKCILHCEKTKKNKWILEDNIYNESDISSLYFKWDEEKVKLFWQNLEFYTQVSFLENKTTILKENILKSREEKGEGFKDCFSLKGLIVPPLLDNNIFLNDKKIGEYKFKSCIFLDNFIITGITDKKDKDYSPLAFKKSIFEKDLTFFRFSTAFDYQEISECKFKESLKIYGICDSVDIDKSHIHRTLYLGGSLHLNKKLSNITLRDLKLNDLNISNHKCFEKVYADKIKIKNILNIENTSLKEFYFKNSFINNLNIDNINLIDNSNIYFEKLEINKLQIDSLHQDSKNIQFNHIKINDELQINRANLTNVTFNDFNIKNAKKKIEKTNFIDSSLNSVFWGNISKIKASKDIFRQLKFVNDKQANYIDANNFYSMEMKKHKEELKKDSWFSNYWQEKLIFLLNEKISNFGQSWFLVLLWIIIFNLSIFSVYKLFNINLELSKLFFSLLILIIPFILGLGLKERFSNKKLSFYTLPYIFLIISIIYSMFYFQIWNINELIVFSSFKLKESNDSAYLVFWMLNKSILGFLIYHFVVSLRRQTRR